MKKNNPIYLQEMRLSCSAGVDNETLFKALLSGTSGVKKHPNVLLDGALSAIGKIDTELDFNRLLEQQIESVLHHCGLENFEDTFLAIGTSVGGMAWAEKQFIRDQGHYHRIALEKQSIHSLAYRLKGKFHFKDAISFSTACTSSANALVFAKELLQSGAYEQVLVVGADQISYTTVNGFHALGVLSSECAKPFDQHRTGMNVAEGIGVILLSHKKSAIQLAGTGCSSDAHNITHPHPEGNGAKLAMQRALEDASILAEKIEYINAHGTGTEANDRAEGRAILALFPHRPVVGSTKSITGHTLGACGVIEAIISAMILEKQMIPANFNLENPELEALNLIRENQEKNIEFVLSNSFAFGGNNVSLILQKVAV